MLHQAITIALAIFLAVSATLAPVPAYADTTPQVCGPTDPNGDGKVDAGDIACQTLSVFEADSVHACAEACQTVNERLAALESKTASIITGTNAITVTGNLHVVNGTGTTGGDPNGLGNVIVGYNELRPSSPNPRTGSHMVIVGSELDYTGFGGINTGNLNTTAGPYASIVSGWGNLASGDRAFIGGGQGNEAAGLLNTIAGGSNNTAGGLVNTIAGGEENTTHQYARTSAIIGGRSNQVGTIITETWHALVNGGLNNTVNGNESVAVGGKKNLADGEQATVVGGEGNESLGKWTLTAGGKLNRTVGWHSAINGGRGNYAFGQFSTIDGGNDNHASGFGSRISGGSNNNAHGFYSSLFSCWGSTVWGGSQYGMCFGSSDSEVGSPHTEGHGNRTVVIGGKSLRGLGLFSVAVGGDETATVGDYSTVVGLNLE